MNDIHQHHRIFLLMLLPIIFSLNSCVPKNEIKSIDKSFDKFEISYTNGLTLGFSYLIDSNKIYFQPRLNQIYYGILPDSIFRAVNECAKRIITDSTIKWNIHRCYDCNEVAIIITNNKDTSYLYQSYKVDTSIWKVINMLSDLSKDSAQNEIDDIYMDLGTRRSLIKAPPTNFKEIQKEIEALTKEINAKKKSSL